MKSAAATASQLALPFTWIVLPPFPAPTVSLWPLRLPHDRWLTVCAWHYCYDDAPYYEAHKLLLQALPWDCFLTKHCLHQQCVCMRRHPEVKRSLGKLSKESPPFKHVWCVLQMKPFETENQKQRKPCCSTAWNHGVWKNINCLKSRALILRVWH